MPSVRLIRHEAVRRCGNFEIRFADGRPWRYFYWDDLAGRRLNPALVDSERALEKAKAFARAERDKAASHSWSRSVAKKTCATGF
jgi:hypothetical protein